MATKELEGLRLGFNAAYASYLSSVRLLSDASVRGKWPTEEVLRTEQAALADLTRARDAFLRGLYEHCHGDPKSRQRGQP